MATHPADPDRLTIERIFREEAGRALATVARITGDLDVAEDAVQDAFLIALRVWPERGTPPAPGAWITTTARNRALDRLRREQRRPAKERAATDPDETMHEDAYDDEVHPVPDDQLRLIFTCCHPALAPAARVGLTLRLVCGLTTDQIARAFLEPVPTIAQRLSRAKAKIRHAGIPLRVPPAELLPERLPGVLACIYLVFTEGYAATDGDRLIRRELCDEAIRLATLVADLLPGEPEAAGLLALLLFQDSRRDTRQSPEGALVLLEDQDRQRWDPARISAGQQRLEQALALRRPGRYQLEAAIAAEHARAATWEDTDWPTIAALYAELTRVAPSPVVELNRAVAVSYAEGAAAGLALLDTIADDRRLAMLHRLPAVRADLLRRAGRRQDALDAYREALTMARTAPETQLLRDRLMELGGSP